MQKLIKSGDILVNNKTVQPSYLVKLSDEIKLNIPEEEDYNLNPVNLDLEVVYEDEYLAIINKPKGLVVHPSDSYKDITLINGLIYQFGSLSNQKEPFRQGIVHRLDKDTSGLLIISKDDITHQKLKTMFQRRKITKYYLAIVYHEFKEFSGIIDKAIVRHPKRRQHMTTSLTGRRAITKFEVISQHNGFAYLKLDLITGRTHQIRVHMQSINHPILGDPIYGPKKIYGSTGPYLHAYRLIFTHPITKKELDIKIKPPFEFNKELINRQLISE